MELKFDLFLYYTAWICWHFNFAINVWDHKLLWYFIYKLWTLYNFCHAGCWHILLRIKKKNVLPEACKTSLFVCLIILEFSNRTDVVFKSPSRCQQTTQHPGFRPVQTGTSKLLRQYSQFMFYMCFHDSIMVQMCSVTVTCAGLHQLLLTSTAAPS